MGELTPIGIPTSAIGRNFAKGNGKLPGNFRVPQMRGKVAYFQCANFEILQSASIAYTTATVK